MFLVMASTVLDAGVGPAVLSFFSVDEQFAQDQSHRTPPLVVAMGCCGAVVFIASLDSSGIAQFVMFLCVDLWTPTRPQQQQHVYIYSCCLYIYICICKC